METSCSEDSIQFERRGVQLVPDRHLDRADDGGVPDPEPHRLVERVLVEHPRVEREALVRDLDAAAVVEHVGLELLAQPRHGKEQLHAADQARPPAQFVQRLALVALPADEVYGAPELGSALPKYKSL